MIANWNVLLYVYSWVSIESYLRRQINTRHHCTISNTTTEWLVHFQFVIKNLLLYSSSLVFFSSRFRLIVNVFFFLRVYLFNFHSGIVCVYIESMWFSFDPFSFVPPSDICKREWKPCFNGHNRPSIKIWKGWNVKLNWPMCVFFLRSFIRDVASMQ